MKKKQLIGVLKKIDTTSKVDDNGMEIHTVTTKIELVKDDGGRENVQDIANNLNKIIRVDFDSVQMKANL